MIFKLIIGASVQHKNTADKNIILRTSLLLALNTTGKNIILHCFYWPHLKKDIIFCKSFHTCQVLNRQLQANNCVHMFY